MFTFVQKYVKIPKTEDKNVRWYHRREIGQVRHL